MLNKIVAYPLKDYSSALVRLERCGQLIVHPDCVAASQPETATAIALGKKLPGKNNLVVPWYVDNPQPPVALENFGFSGDSFQIAETLTSMDNVSSFIQETPEIILSGGGFGVCHFAYFKRIVSERVLPGRAVVFHFVMPAIFPQALTEELIRPLENNYFLLLKSPYKFFVDKLQRSREEFSKSAWAPYTDGISAGIFFNGTLLWHNADQVRVIINYWSALPAMLSPEN